jgi:manganese/zinc/iron transport system permease protein
MPTNFLPEWDLYRFLSTPWIDGQALDSFWIVLMGFLSAATCGLVGNFLILRRLALIGDAISHSILPGIVIAFLITQSRGVFPMFLGAISAGILTTGLIEYIRSHSRLKTDTIIGISFSTLFSIGIILTALYADKIDLDQDCVLYGDLAFIPYQASLELGTVSVPLPIIRSFCVLVFAGLCIYFLYKELLVSSFDGGLARCLGIKPHRIYYGLKILVSLAIVASFEAVGAILAVAMLIFPGATASLLGGRLPRLLGYTLVLSALYALLGLHLSFWLNCSVGGAMVLVAAGLLGVIWLGKLVLARFQKISLPEDVTKITISHTKEA